MTKGVYTVDLNVSIDIDGVDDIDISRVRFRPRYMVNGKLVGTGEDPPAVYNLQMQEFDGEDDYLVHPPGILVDHTQNILALYFRIDDVAQTYEFIDVGGFYRFTWYGNQNKFVFVSRQSNSDVAVRFDLPKAGLTTGRHFIIIAYDTASSANLKVRLDDVVETENVTSVTFVESSTISLTDRAVTIGARTNTSFRVNGAMGDIYIACGGFLDIDNDTHYNKFILASGNPRSLTAQVVAANIPDPQVLLTGNWAQGQNSNQISTAITQALLNSSFTNGVSGTPGTVPDDMSCDGSENGLVRTLTFETIKNSFGEDVPAMRVKVAGHTTTNSTFFITFAQSQVIDAVQSEDWAVGCDVRLITGTRTGITNEVLRIEAQDSGGGFLENFVDEAFTPDGTLTRIFGTGAITEATTAYVRSYIRFSYADDTDIDYELLITEPTLHKGTKDVGKSIQTSGAAILGGNNFHVVGVLSSDPSNPPPTPDPVNPEPGLAQGLYFSNPLWTGLTTGFAVNNPTSQYFTPVTGLLAMAGHTLCRGFVYNMTWHAYEPNEDDYNDLLTDRIVADAEAMGKQVIFSLSRHSFGSWNRNSAGGDNQGCAGYIRADNSTYGSTDGLGFGGIYYMGGSVDFWATAIHRTAVMTRFIAAVKHLITRYKNNPNVRGVWTVESAQKNKDATGGYTAAAFLTEHKRLTDEIHAMDKGHIIFSNHANWLSHASGSNRADMSHHIAAKESVLMHTGSPDFSGPGVYPYHGDWNSATPEACLISTEMQNPGLQQIQSGQFTHRQVLDYFLDGVRGRNFSPIHEHTQASGFISAIAANPRLEAWALGDVSVVN